MMLSDLNNVMDEVKVIEGKVAEISKLQHMFNEQVSNLFQSIHF